MPTEKTNTRKRRKAVLSAPAAAPSPATSIAPIGPFQPSRGDLAPIPSPTDWGDGVEDETFFFWPYQLQSLMEMAEKGSVRVRRTDSAAHGSCDVIECRIERSEHVFVHVRFIDGVARGFGWGWQRCQLRREIARFTEPGRIAWLALLFGDLLTELLDERAPA